jgi:hypothetical protein
MASFSSAFSGLDLGKKLFGGLKSGEQGIGQAMGRIGSAYGGARQSLQPWQDYGTQTLADLRQFTTGDPTQAVLGDPTYKFGYGQGMTALENSAAARNRALSGRALKESMQYGQDYGMSKYNDILNRKLGLAQFGYQPTLTAADLAIGEGSALAGLEAEKGKARQSRYQGYLDLGANIGGKIAGMG